MLPWGQCPRGYSISGLLCYLLLSLPPASVQSDRVATVAQKSYSYVALEVGQRTNVCY